VTRGAAPFAPHQKGSDAVSREIDTSKSLSDDDKLYLAQRGQLSTDVMSVQEQRELLDPENAGPSTLQLANTGTVATMTVEELEAALADKRKAHEETDPQKLFTNPGGLAGAAASSDSDEDDEEALEAPYDQYTKGELSAELIRRNETRSDDDQLPISGTKQELVDALDEDDSEQG